MEIDIEMIRAYFSDMPKNIFLQFILCLIMLDIFTGTFRAIKYKKMNSSFGLQGLGKHLAFFFVVIFATYFLKATRLDVFLYAIYIIYFVFYMTSICENAYQAGWKVPKFVLKNLYIYREKLDDGNIDFLLDTICTIKNIKGVSDKIEKNTNLSKEDSRKLEEIITKTKVGKDVQSVKKEEWVK